MLTIVMPLKEKICSVKPAYNDPIMVIALYTVDGRQQTTSQKNMSYMDFEVNF